MLTTIPGMVVIVLGEPDKDAEHDMYTLVTGICVIFLGELSC